MRNGRPDSDQPPPAPVRPSILVIEDDPSIGRLLAALLESAGYDVKTTANGREALALCIENSPALAFLDVSLPDISGWDVLAQLHAADPSVPVVLLTANSAAVRRAGDAGAAAAILKPFDIDEVLDAAALYTTAVKSETR